MRAVAVHGCASLVLPRLRRDWRRSAARRCVRLPLEAPPCMRYVLTAACTSACAQRVQPRATRSTTCSLLAGPLCCCRPASGSLRRATPSWTISGATASARTLATAYPRSPYAHPRVAIALPFTTAHPVLFFRFRTLSQCLPSGMGASSGSGSDDRTCVYMCVRVGVHCGQLEPAIPPEKTALNFVEISANASQNAKIFSGAARRRLTAGRREKKLRFLGKKCDLANLTFFREKNRTGSLLCRVLVGYLASVCACGQPLARLCWPKFPGSLRK